MVVAKNNNICLSIYIHRNKSTSTGLGFGFIYFFLGQVRTQNRGIQSSKEKYVITPKSKWLEKSFLLRFYDLMNHEWYLTPKKKNQKQRKRKKNSPTIKITLIWRNLNNNLRPFLWKTNTHTLLRMLWIELWNGQNVWSMWKSVVQIICSFKKKFQFKKIVCKKERKQ